MNNDIALTVITILGAAIILVMWASILFVLHDIRDELRSRSGKHVGIRLHPKDD